MKYCSVGLQFYGRITYLGNGNWVNCLRPQLNRWIAKICTNESERAIQIMRDTFGMIIDPLPPPCDIWWIKLPSPFKSVSRILFKWTQTQFSVTLIVLSTIIHYDRQNRLKNQEMWRYHIPWPRINFYLKNVWGYEVVPEMTDSKTSPSIKETFYLSWFEALIFVKTFFAMLKMFWFQKVTWNVLIFPNRTKHCFDSSKKN
jgi:hypothetical protein